MQFHGGVVNMIISIYYIIHKGSKLSRMQIRYFKDWSTYYDDEASDKLLIQVENSKFKFTKITSTQQNVHVMQCSFQGISNEINGGCIEYEANANSRMLVEFSAFFSLNPFDRGADTGIFVAFFGSGVAVIEN